MIITEDTRPASTETEKLYSIIKHNLHKDPAAESKLHIELAKIVSSGIQDSLSPKGSDLGYCFSFTLPILAVKKLNSIMGVTDKDLLDAFTKDWTDDSMKNHMYRDPYYHTTLIIIYYGLIENKPQFSDNGLLVALFKLWNGRKAKFLKYCNNDIMRYVVTNMCTRRNLFAKFSGPSEMLQQHFTPTLLKTYGPRIKTNPAVLQNLFSQAWVRLNQQWVTNMVTDIKTGKKKAQSGILPMYMKAREEGLGLGAAAVFSMDDENGPAFDEHTTTSNRDEIINGVAEFITMNPSPTYSENVISDINSITKVKRSTINEIFTSMHNYQYHNYLQDIIGIILAVTNVSHKNDICNTDYIDKFKKKVIGSKNNEDARRLQLLCNTLLKKIFKHSLQLDYDNYSNVQQIQLRSTILRGILYNMKKSQCRG